MKRLIGEIQLTDYRFSFYGIRYSLHVQRFTDNE